MTAMLATAVFPVHQYKKRRGGGAAVFRLCQSKMARTKRQRPGVTIVHQDMETATAASTAKVSQTLQTNVSVFATLCTVQSAAELSSI